MGQVKEINIKNQMYYFFNDMINIEVLDSNQKQTKKKKTKSCTKTLIFITLDTSQLKKIDDYENIYSINPLYLIIGEVDGHIEEKRENKYLVFDSRDENREVLEKYTELWDGIKNEIKTINGGKEGEYGKDFMKIKFDTDDDLPLNKPLKLPC